MKQLLLKGIHLAFASLLLCCCTGAAWAQTTAFTYQGKLTDGGNPANGNYDMRFRLYDTPTPGTGNQYGSNTRNGVAASAGIFTVTLDFFNVFGTGTPLYLEIGVRPAGSADAFTILSPRHTLTSAPYAVQSLNAANLGAPGSVSAFRVDGASPGAYPSLGFNTDGVDYVAGQAGYGGLFQFENGTGTLNYYTGSNVAAGSQHAHTKRIAIQNNGLVTLDGSAQLTGSLGVADIARIGNNPADARLTVEGGPHNWAIHATHGRIGNSNGLLVPPPSPAGGPAVPRRVRRPQRAAAARPHGPQRGAARLSLVLDRRRRMG